MSVRLFSTDTDAGSISVIDRKNGDFINVARIPVGNEPRGGVKFTKNGRGYVSNCAGDTISEIDTLTNRETARIKVGAAPRGIGIVPGDRYALVSNSGSNYVSIVDLANRKEVFQIAVGRDPRHMAISPDGKWAFVSIWGSHYISKIDISALAKGNVEEIERGGVREVTRIPVGDGAHPYSLALHPKGGYAYVANNQVSYLSIIDTNKDEVEAEIDLGSKGGRAVAFSPDGDLAFVSIEDTSEVVTIDTKTRQITTRWDVGPGPRGIAFDAKNNTIYASAFARMGSGSLFAQRKQLGKEEVFPFKANTLTVIDLPQGQNLKSSAKSKFNEIPVGAGPCSVTILDIDKLRKPSEVEEKRTPKSKQNKT
jgi:YVTN family beta-propeller protein